jgi:hypothetical protein
MFSVHHLPSWRRSRSECGRPPASKREQSAVAQWGRRTTGSGLETTNMAGVRADRPNEGSQEVASLVGLWPESAGYVAQGSELRCAGAYARRRWSSDTPVSRAKLRRRERGDSGVIHWPPPSKLLVAPRPGYAATAQPDWPSRGPAPPLQRHPLAIGTSAWTQGSLLTPSAQPAPRCPPQPSGPRWHATMG